MLRRSTHDLNHLEEKWRFGFGSVTSAAAPQRGILLAGRNRGANNAFTDRPREAAMDLILKRAWWPGVQTGAICVSLALMAGIVLGVIWIALSVILIALDVRAPGSR